jgi:2-polyprenyl-3-methyl-5-hydroxy-6-metoxy-1,4-benzoquinol methylase
VGRRARVVVRPDRTIKTYSDPALAAVEAGWYQRVPWACPRLLDFDGAELVIETCRAGTTPGWRPADELRELLVALHAAGIHHRDVHVRNVVRRSGRPLLIDWETAIHQPSDLSYDLWGPDRSGVPVPDLHRGLAPAWWGSPQHVSIKNQWEGPRPGYQPGWVNGKEVGTGRRDASRRYAAIRRQLLGRRGFSVLDVGAYTGYFAYRLADEFGARCLAVDRNARLEERDNVAVSRRYMGAADFEDIADGAWDVTLLLSVLHHMRDWRRALAAVLRFSGVAFVELPDARERLPNAAMHHETAAMHEAVAAAGGVQIASTEGFDARFQRRMFVVGRLR